MACWKEEALGIMPDSILFRKSISIDQNIDFSFSKERPCLRRIPELREFSPSEPAAPSPNEEKLVKLFVVFGEWQEYVSNGIVCRIC
jgi:hypothetical protein